jgi:hypothetical protein
MAGAGSPERPEPTWPEVYTIFQNWRSYEAGTQRNTPVWWSRSQSVTQLLISEASGSDSSGAYGSGSGSDDLYDTT